MNQSNGNSNTVLLWVLIGCGAALLVCCGIGLAFFFWVRGAAQDFAETVAEIGDFDEMFAQQVQADIVDNPVILEHIGDIQSISYDMDASMEEPGDIYVFYLTGTKGSGTLRAECITIDADHEDVPSGELTMDSGDVYQLFPENPLNEEPSGDGFSDEFARQVKVEIESNPVILEHIGQITDIKYDLDLSVNEPGDVYVFHLTGSIGSGTLRAECITISTEKESVPSGELTMSTGAVHQLFPNNPLEE